MPISCICNLGTQVFEVRERGISFFARITGIVIGIITFSSGILILWGIDRSVGGFLTAGGGGLIVLSCCLKNRRNRPSENLTPVPPPLSHLQPTTLSFLDIVDPLEKSAGSIDVPRRYTIPHEDGTCLFHVDYLSCEMCVYIFSFLGARDLVNGMSVSKEFYEILQSGILWNKYLTHPEYRVWGATRWNLTNESGKYLFVPEGEEIHNKPLQQLKMYHILRQKKEVGENNFFYDYLCRLMPGGPLAFNAIPKIELENAGDLTMSHMDAPIVRGIDKANRDFFAMRVVDSSNENNKPILLLFIRRNASNIWKQKANEYWNKNKLKISHQEDLNYILAIIAKKPLNTNYYSSSLKNTVELV